MTTIVTCETEEQANDLADLFNGEGHGLGVRVEGNKVCLPDGHDRDARTVRAMTEFAETWNTMVNHTPA